MLISKEKERIKGRGMRTRFKVREGMKERNARNERIVEWSKVRYLLNH
jgi:hypothetical protein